jgi:hypothetical protein
LHENYFLELVFNCVNKILILVCCLLICHFNRVCGAAGGFDGKQWQGEWEYKEILAAAVAINTWRAATAAMYAGRARR